MNMTHLGWQVHFGGEEFKQDISEEKHPRGWSPSFNRRSLFDSISSYVSFHSMAGDKVATGENFFFFFFA